LRTQIKCSSIYPRVITNKAINNGRESRDLDVWCSVRWVSLIVVVGIDRRVRRCSYKDT